MVYLNVAYRDTRLRQNVVCPYRLGNIYAIHCIRRLLGMVIPVCPRPREGDRTPNVMEWGLLGHAMSDLTSDVRPWRRHALCLLASNASYAGRLGYPWVDERKDAGSDVV